MPFKFRMDNAGGAILSLTPFIYAPNGAYNNPKAVNAGGKRWRYLMQGVWIYHVSDTWVFTAGADVSWTT